MTIRAYRWNVEKKQGAAIDGEVLMCSREEVLHSDDMIWVDLEAPTVDEETHVFQSFFGIHSLSLEDITHLRRKPQEPPHFPKVEEFPDYLFVIVNPLTQHLVQQVATLGADYAGSLLGRDSPVTQLSAVLTRRLLITHHYEPVNGIDMLRSHLEKHPNTAARGPDYMFHLILDDMVDEYAPALDRLSDALEEYEVKVFRKPNQEMLSRLIECKRTIILLRKTLIYEREVLARMARGDFDLIDDREAAYYRNVYDHLIRFTELIEASREMVSDLMQMYLAAASNRMNEIMKVLTMITTAVLPMTLIAGIYGMNFQKLTPGIDAEYGFEISLGLMLLSGFAAFLFFQWRKWL